MMGRLCNSVFAVAIHDVHLRIHDVWDGGGWNLNLLMTPIPDDIVQQILGVTSWLVDSIQDTWVWNHCISGVYSARRGYRWLAQASRGTLQLGGSWAWIWKLPLPANIHFFAWQLCHDSLPVRVTLHHRGIPLSAACPYVLFVMNLSFIVC